MRVTSKGQVTIPVEILEKMGFRGKRLVERIRGRATIRMSTDEIVALTRGED